jgi:hypothetical protein
MKQIYPARAVAFEERLVEYKTSVEAGIVKILSTSRVKKETTNNETGSSPGDNKYPNIIWRITKVKWIPTRCSLTCKSSSRFWS